MPEAQTEKRSGNRLGLPGRQAFAALAVATVLLFLLVFTAWQVVARRTEYFQRRDLHALANVGTDIENFTMALRQAASLHFDPNAMDFSLSPDTQCLVGSIEVPTGDVGSILIQYQFVDPARSREWISRLAAEDDRPPTATAGGEAPALSESIPPAARFPSKDRCKLLRPPGREAVNSVTLDQNELRIEQSYRLATLLSPIVATTSEPRAKVVADVKAVLLNAAQAQLRRKAVTTMPRDGSAPDDPEELARISIDTAFASNAIGIAASARGAPIGSRELDKHFDAIALYGPAAAGSPDQRRPLWRIGEVPPLLDRRDIETADRTLAGFIGSGAKPSASETPKQGSRDDHLAPAGGSVARIGNLVIYQRDFVSDDGLKCPIATPCKLVAVREAAAFDREVRKLDGIQATWLLIGVLTVIALLPLLQLMLGKRLDALPRIGQYGLWLALSLLTADAVIAAFTLWSTDASLAQGKEQAQHWTDDASGRFGAELRDSVKRVAGIADLLANVDMTQRSRPIFPMPRALNCTWPRQRAGTMFLESVTLFNKNGTARIDRPRWHTQLTPAFGASIGQRDYLRRAKANDYAELEIEHDRFRIAQVYSRPDGQPKTILLVPPLLERLPEKHRIAAKPPPLIGDAADAIDCEPPGGIYHRDNAPAKRQPEIADTYAVATGVLQTFLFFDPKAGFRYAVIDPTIAHGPNVLFHSEPEAELTDRLQDDIDSPRQFDQAVRGALAKPTTPGQTEAPIEIDTHYRAMPVRLWVKRLHPQLDWVIVIIEDRSQAGFTLWREAMTGYVIWAVAMLLVGLVISLFMAAHRGTLDRSPGVWLWPSRVLEDWTPQYTSDLICVARVRNAQARMAPHLALSLLLFVGVFLADGPARILLAFTVTAHVAAARIAFLGSLSRDPDAGMIRDRIVSGIAASFALITIIAVIMSGELPAPAALVTTLLAVLALCHGVALACGRTWPDDATAEAWRKFVSPVPWWALALLLGCAAPPIAGFLDAFDANGRWATIAEREQRAADYSAISQRVTGLGRSLENGGTLKRMEKGRKRDKWSFAQGGPALTSPCAQAELTSVPWSVSVVCWLGMDRNAVEASRTPPPIWTFPRLVPLEGLLPLILLAGALLVFRKHYFAASPPRPIASANLTRDNVATRMLQWVKDGAASAAPVALRRYLIVGADEQIEISDELAKGVHRIRMFNLLHEKAPLDDPKSYDAVVVFNFDAAMLAPLSCMSALDMIEKLVAQQNADPQQGFGTLFLLASTEPLDRIVFSRVMENADPTPATPTDPRVSAAEYRRSTEVRWAELLRPFALRTVQPPPPVTLPVGGTEASLLFHRELLALGSPAAERVRNQVPTFPDDVSDNDVIAFVADSLAEQYRMLWETSTADEQVILYYLARGGHLKMHDSFALRSLLLRRLIVRTPEYRLVNRSFRRFIASIGNPRAMREQALTATDGTDKVWPLLRVPLAMLVVAASGMLAIVAPDGVGMAAIIPAVTASLPALLSSWFRARTTG